MSANDRLRNALAAATLVVAATAASGHDTEVVHPGLTDSAVEAAGHDLLTPFGNDLRQGSIDEDDGLQFCDHAYNPRTGRGWDCFLAGLACSSPTVARDKAATLWNQAVAAYQRGDRAGALHSLGRALHLIQDMTSPAHIHEDCHGVCGVVDQDDLECWEPTHFAPSSGVAAVVPGDGSPQTFVHELAAFTYGKSTFQGILVATKPQPDSVLKRMFPGLYFHDGGWLGDDYWYIPNVGGFEVALEADGFYASPGDTTEDDDGPGGSRRMSGNFYIENSGGDDGELAPAVWEGRPNTRTLLRIWADELFPAAVAYGAGFLLRFAQTVCVPPMAAFDAAPQSGLTPLTVAFTDRSTGDCISSRQWSFGDGATSADRNPTHTYTAAGVYTASLTVRGDCGEHTAGVSIAAGYLLGPPAEFSSAADDPQRVYAGERVTLRWSSVAGANGYTIEAAVRDAQGAGGEWFEVAGPPALSDTTFAPCLDRAGSWTFRVRAVNAYGQGAAVETPAIEVLDSPLVAYWPLDGCAGENRPQDLAGCLPAQPDDSARDGRIAGSVACGADRFGAEERSLDFTGAGAVDGRDLPILEGDFGLGLWFHASPPPNVGEEAGVLLELFETAAPLDGLRRRLLLKAADSRVIFETGRNGASIEAAGGASACWHHVLVSRRGERTALYFDGVLRGVAESDSSPVADGFTMGASAFRGRLDAVVYERRSYEASDLPRLMLRGGPSAYLFPHASGAPAETAVDPHGPERIEALRLRLRTGETAPASSDAFALRQVLVRAKAIASPADSGEGAPALADVFKEGKLLLAVAGGGEVEVGRLEAIVDDSVPGQATFSAALSPHPALPANADCYAIATFERPSVKDRFRVRFGVASPDDLAITFGDARPCFVAGQRLASNMAAEGDTLVFTPLPPPPMGIAPLQPTASLDPGSPSRELVAFALAPRASGEVTEDVTIRKLVFHSTAGPGATLAGVANVRLLDRNGTQLGSGTVVPETGEIRVENIAATIDPARGAELCLWADLEGYAPAATASGGAWIRRANAPRGGPLESVCLFLLVPVAFAIAELARRRRLDSRRIARIAIAGLCFATLAGSSCDGSGGSSPPPAAFVQVSLAQARDVDAVGDASGDPVAIEGFPAGGIVGPRFTARL